MATLNTPVATFLDVRQGDSTVIDFANNQFGVIDFGTDVSGRDIVGPAVKKRVANGQTFLFAALTHFDDDHAGGLPAVFKTQRPRYMLLPGMPLDLIEQCARKLSSRQTLAGIKALKKFAQGVTTLRLLFHSPLHLTEIPGVKFFALSPDNHFEDELRDLLDDGSDPRLMPERLRALRNRGSLALYIDLGSGGSLLLLGEAESDQYGWMWSVVQKWVGTQYRAPNIIKLSHHGSRRNNPPELFQFFVRKGALTVASAGGRHSHPDVTVLERVQGAGATPSCTNLGKGCSLLNQLGTLPMDIAGWRAANAHHLKKAPVGRPKCHGTITVYFGGTTGTAASFSSTPSACHFGGSRMIHYSLPVLT